MSVNLKEKPFYLSDSQIEWVNKTKELRTQEEKIQQLFIHLTAKQDEAYLKDVVTKWKFGGARFNPSSAENIAKHNFILQRETKIPLLIAANTESGGNGAYRGGTEVGCETKVASTKDPHYAYELGKVSAEEAKAVGINTLFAPIVDINYQFHNPIIPYRTFGNDPDRVKEFSLEFLKGVQEEGLLACAKHFPGDGVDERDQHLSLTSNTLSCEEWDKSYGKVYSALIDASLPRIRVGHIALPSYQKKFSKDENIDVLPASVSKEILTSLLRGKLGFNGLIVSDATHRVGLTASRKRSEFLPKMVEAGIDRILFYNDYDEDIEYRKNGLKKGLLSKERLEEAVTRILATKARLDPSLRKPQETPIYSLMGTKEHREVQDEVSDKGIVLVKEEKGVLPLSPEKGKRILLVPQHEDSPFDNRMPKRGPSIYETIAHRLEEKGFQVTIFESLRDKAKKLPPREALSIISNVYNNKTPIKELTDNYDLVIHVCDFDTHNTVNRRTYKRSKGTPDVPWYVNELPTIRISLKNPFHLFDAPQVKTYINCYDKNPSTISHLIRKLTGEEKFLGVSPVDCFCLDPLCRK